MISSAKNPLVRHVCQVRDGKEPAQMVAEGVRLVEEALDAGREVLTSLVSPRLVENDRGSALLARLAAVSRDHRECDDEVLARASGLTTHQGVLAVLARPQWGDDDLFAGAAPFLVIAAGVRDPGNLGALVRTAEAVGASGLLALAGSADPFRDKALRGSSGSIFRLPCRGGVTPAEIADLVARRGLELVATDSRRGTDLWELDFGPAPQAFVVGSEAAGIPEPILDLCRRFVRVPMAGPVESLNVAVAAGLVLFEHRRRLRGLPT